MARLLLEYHAPSDVVNEKGETPLDLAGPNNQKRFKRLLAKFEGGVSDSMAASTTVEVSSLGGTATEEGPGGNRSETGTTVGGGTVPSVLDGVPRRRNPWLLPDIGTSSLEGVQLREVGGRGVSRTNFVSLRFAANEPTTTTSITIPID